MKEKVKDLDPVLQEMLMRETNLHPFNADRLAQPYLDKVDWKLATNEERLKYSELMYGKGVVFKTVVSGKHIISSGKFEIFGDNITECLSCYCAYYGNQWAEIISRPEDKEETKEPEFQPGEYVNAYNPNHAEKEDVYFTGGMTEEGEYILQGAGGYLFTAKEIRKIQPDPEKKFSDKADEILNAFKQPHGYFKCSAHKIHFDNDSVKMMLIEALKTEVK